MHPEVFVHEEMAESVEDVVDDESTTFKNEISEYIRTLGYKENVITDVERSKVSSDTIKYFNKDDFQRMGIALAHAYQIVDHFSKGESSKSQRLQELMVNARSRKEITYSSKNKRKKKAELSLHFCWYEYERKREKYMQIRGPKGGGSRCVMMSRYSKLTEVLEMAKSIFFPRGKSRKGKLLLDYIAVLGDFSQSEVEDDMASTVDEYINKYGFTIPKFCLLTKELSFLRRMETHVINDNISSDEDFFPATNFKHSTPQSVSISSSSEVEVSPVHSREVEERRILIKQQDAEYHESLAMDKKKDEQIVIDLEAELQDKKEHLSSSNQQRAEKLRREIYQLSKKEEIRKARAERVLPEPEIQEDCVVIYVQHVSMGKIQRLFSPDSAVQAIYDWVGSLSHDPCHFNICQHSANNIISPDEKISSIPKSVLSMFERIIPIENAPDESITFAGHHVNYLDIYQSVEHKRSVLDDQLSPVIKTVQVNRQSVMEDLMKTFGRSRDILNHRMVIKFEDEVAFGDGVAREAFSLFIDQLLLRSFEGTSQFVPIVQPEFSDDEYSIVGKILNHFFINFAIFPIQFSRASMEYAFLGTCSNNVLLESFFAYCSKSQASTLQRALNNEAFIRDELITILSQYGVRTIPSKDNVADLVQKAAKNELITKPWPALVCIKNGFKNFFDELGKHSISSLYELALPTPSKVLSYITFQQAMDQQEEKAYSFLQRFVEECSPEMLKDFLQFVSGCSFILPGLKIGVSAKVMSDIESRPISKVCIKLLLIPKNIQTYHAFKSVMEYYLIHNEFWAMED